MHCRSFPASLIVHPCYVGGDFGGKGDANEVALCYALAKRSGRPVKLLIDYSEELIAGNPRHGAIDKVKTGVKKNGIMIAQRIEFVFDSGAYGSYRPQGYLVGAHDAAGPYRVANCFIEEKYVYTNKMPCGYMRAPGHLQAFFATESHADLVAKRLEMDPAEYRRMNFMRDGDKSPLGEVMPHVKPGDTLIKARARYPVTAVPSPKMLAAAARLPIGFPKAASPTLSSRSIKTGVITLSSAVTDTGPGAFTIMRQIVGQELKVCRLSRFESRCWIRLK